MTISAEVLDAMLAAGCSAEQIVSVVKAELVAVESKRNARRANDAERQRRHRHAMSQMSRVTESDTPPPFVPPDKEAPIPQEITPPISPRPAERERAANPAVVLQSVVDAMSAQSFVAHCSEKRRPLSSQQAEEIASVLKSVRSAGGSPAEALRMATAKGWTTVDLEWLRNAGLKLAAQVQAAPSEANWNDRLTVWRQDKTWIPAWGPTPDESGCRAPAELLRAAA